MVTATNETGRLTEIDLPLPMYILKMPSYFEMEKYIEMVCDGTSNFCVVVSEGGMAKTWSTRQILRQKKVAFAYLNSFTSPLEFYNFLYDHAREEVLLIDDCEGIWENRSVVGLLKNATELNGNRSISWNSTTSRLGRRRTSTPFTSRIILLTNQLPNPERNEHIRAILGRAFVCRLDLSYQEKMTVIREVAQQTYPGLDGADRSDVLAFLERNTSAVTPELSIRTLIKCYQFYAFSKHDWKELALRMLEADPRREIVLELLKSDMPVSEQEKVYIARTGRSRADFFRIRQEIKGLIAQEGLQLNTPRDGMPDANIVA